MKDLLFISHRIPYPPTKGDKIRSFHLLQFLLSHYRVHLGTFIDNPDDWQYVSDMEQMVNGESFFVGLNPRLAKIRSLSGLITGDALTFPYYKNKKMSRWVDNILATNKIDIIVVFSAALAQFVLGENACSARRVIDFVDVDSDKWRQYAKNERGFNRWIYNREGEKLLARERQLAATFQASLFVSEAESNLFKTLAPESAHKIDYLDAGVDSDYFSPDRDYPNPYDMGQLPLVFTGTMNYRPNIDAVTWFAKEIFPLIRQVEKNSHFVIVGGGATPEVWQLADSPGITVTGRVDDVRPYIAHGKVSVAPIRLARGIQFKVLEAMAMARPVVATSQAMEGIRLCKGLEKWVCDDAPGIANNILTLLNTTPTTPTPGQLGRRCMLERYHWDSNMQRALQTMEG